MKEFTHAEFVEDLADIIYDRNDGVCEYIIKDLQNESPNFLFENLVEFSCYKYWALYTSISSELENDKKNAVHTDYYLYLKKYIRTDKELKSVFDTVLGKLEKYYTNDESYTVSLDFDIKERYKQRFAEYDKIPRAKDAAGIMEYFSKLKDIFIRHVHEWPVQSSDAFDESAYTNRITAYFNNTFSMVSSRVSYHPTFVDEHKGGIKIVSMTVIFCIALFIFRKLLASDKGDTVYGAIQMMENGIVYLVVAIFVLIFLIIALKLIMGRRRK